MKTVLFQVIQFSISTQFSSIQPIDRVPPGATTPGHGGPRAMAKKGCSVFPKAPALLQPHHQIVQCSFQDTSWRGSYSSACTRGILQLQPTGQQWKKCADCKGDSIKKQISVGHITRDYLTQPINISAKPFK